MKTFRGLLYSGLLVVLFSGNPTNSSAFFTPEDELCPNGMTVVSNCTIAPDVVNSSQSGNSSNVTGSINLTTIPKMTKGALTISSGTEVVFSWADWRNGATCKTNWGKTVHYKFGVMEKLVHTPTTSGLYTVACTASGVGKKSSVLITVIPVPAGAVSIVTKPAQYISNTSATLEAELTSGDNAGVYTGVLYVDYTTSLKDFDTSLNTRVSVQPVSELPTTGSIDITNLKPSTEYFTRFCLRNNVNSTDICSKPVSFKTLSQSAVEANESLPQQSVTLSLSPEDVAPGAAMSVLWSATPAQDAACTLSSVGKVNPTGYIKTKAVMGKTYTITCTFGGVTGSISDSKTVGATKSNTVSQNSVNYSDYSYKFTNGFVSSVSEQSARFDIAVTSSSSITELPEATLYLDYVPVGSSFGSVKSQRIIVGVENSTLILNEVKSASATGLETGKVYAARFCVTHHGNIEICSDSMNFTTGTGSNTTNTVVPLYTATTPVTPSIVTTGDVQYSVSHGGSSNQIIYSYLPLALYKTSGRMETVILSPSCPATVTLYTKKLSGGTIKKKVKKLDAAAATRYTTTIKSLKRNTKYKMWAKVVNCKGTTVAYPITVKTSLK